MGIRDARVDAYIAKSADFAQPILRQVREQMHRHCPDVEETIKWGFPHFEYKGILAGMAAFKAHCALHFWNGTQIGLGERQAESMGQFGRMTTVKDLPTPREMAKLIKAAMALKDAGVKSPARAKPKTEKKELVVPDYFAAQLKKNKKALATFEAFSYTNKKDYLEWITEAKTELTRDKRIAQALEWMAEGKARNWKYLRN